MGQNWYLQLGFGVALAACQSAPKAPRPVDLAWGSAHRFESMHLSAVQLQQSQPGVLQTPVLYGALPFDRVLVSWNADAPEEGSYSVELRVGDAEGWSAWLWLADWGAASSGPGAGLQSCARGKIDVDAFVASVALDRVQLRLRGMDRDAKPAAAQLSRLDICLRQAQSYAAARETPPPAAYVARGLPALSQHSAPASIAGRICSPTSLAMLLGFHGRPAPLEQVAALAFDPWHDIYGNWPRAIQTAWSFGVPGYLTCFSRWEPLEKMVASGQPVIISIRVAPGGLSAAPYGETPGHLLVVLGFDGQGGVLVHDPAAASAALVARVYARAELGRAWFGHGGVAYVLASPQEPG